MQYFTILLYLLFLQFTKKREIHKSRERKFLLSSKVGAQKSVEKECQKKDPFFAVVLFIFQPPPSCKLIQKQSILATEEEERLSVLLQNGGSWNDVHHITGH
jgi:hypothetical protein